MRYPILALALAALPSLAAAQWVRTGQGPSTSAFASIQSPDGTNVFAAGGRVDLSSGLPQAFPLVEASSDGGRTFADIAGALATAPGTAAAISFVDATHGFVAVGTKLYRTSDRGGTWTPADAGVQLQALWFFDALHGVAAARGGAIRLTADGGQTFSAATVPAAAAPATLGHLFFLDALHGFATGFDDTNPVAPQGALVLATGDGGQTWAARATLPAGVGLGPITFLPGGQVGWLAAFTFPTQDHAQARLYETTDGAATFSDLGLPLQVGTLNFVVSSPIDTSYLQALYFADETHGHLGGTAYVATTNQSSGGGSGSTDIYRTVDYVTSDGTTWQKTDLGTITMDLTNPPPDDGAIAWGALRDLWTGWMAGGEASTWRYAKGCSVPADCGPGYTCNAGSCEAAAGADGGADAGAAADGGARAADGGGSAPDAGTPDGGHKAAGGSAPPGCGCGGGPAPFAALLLLFAPALLRRRAAR